MQGQMKLKVKYKNMYFEEEIRFGRLYYKTSPNGKWRLKKVQKIGDLTDYQTRDTLTSVNKD